MHFEYIDKIRDILLEIEHKEFETMSAAVDLIVNKILHQQQIFVFGASHAGILTEELFYRAGGLALFNPIFEPSLMLSTRPVVKTSDIERLEGYGEIILSHTKARNDDLILIHSVSGRNPVAIDLAIAAKKRGLDIIVLTNLSYSKCVTSRHSSGKKLFELADVVLDNHGDLGDACVQIEGMKQKVSPTSTAIGSIIMNSIVVEVARTLIKNGIMPPVFHSANVDGGDAFNRAIFEKYKDFIHYL